MRCNLLDEQMILLSFFGNRALYLIFPCYVSITKNSFVKEDWISFSIIDIQCVALTQDHPLV